MEPIKTEMDYERALIHINELWDCMPYTKDAETLKALGIAVDEYEKIHYPISTSNHGNC